MKLALLVIGRTAFVAWLIVVALFGLVSLIGYPGPFILTAFSLGGAPAWIIVRPAWLWLVALAIAAAACVLPFWLLILYTGDGDFTVAGLIWQLVFLSAFAYGLAWFGLFMGRLVWLPVNRRD